MSGHTQDKSLRVRCTLPPSQFEISNNHVEKGNFDREYVNFSGYYGEHGPHVFATAPELLAALQELLSATEEVGYVHYAPLRAKARAAIAKAAGQ